MKTKIWKLLSFVVFLLSMMFIAAPEPVQAATTINFTSGAYRQGNNIYYALGVSKGSSSHSYSGNIRKYNINTNTNTLAAKGKYVEVIADSKYLYATENKTLGYGGDVYSCAIYRINKNGKSRKLLDHGESPVKIGKYLYYIKVKKASWNGCYQNPVGIYRMTTSGTNKKCIYRGNNIYELGYAGKKLYFSNGSNFYSMNLDGSGRKKINTKNYNSTENNFSEQKVVCNGWSFKADSGTVYDNTLYAIKNGVRKKIATTYMDGFYIIQVKDRILVRTTSKDAHWWYYYIMKPDGTGKHYVCKTIRGN